MGKKVVFRLVANGIYSANNVNYPTRAKANAACRRYSKRYAGIHFHVVQRTIRSR